MSMPWDDDSGSIEFLPKRFDATTKQLFEDHPEDWLALIGIQGVETEPAPTDYRTFARQADYVLRISQPSPWLSHWEFQTRREPAMPTRCLEYNVAATVHAKLPVRTTVALLRPEADHPNITGRLIHTMSGGPANLTFDDWCCAFGNCRRKDCCWAGWERCPWCPSPT